jgi:hypothetical protein
MNCEKVASKTVAEISPRQQSIFQRMEIIADLERREVVSCQLLWIAHH